jgi:hypothetical protein
MKLSVKRTPESPVSEGAVVALDAVYGKIAKRLMPFLPLVVLGNSIYERSATDGTMVRRWTGCGCRKGRDREEKASQHGQRC